MLDYLDKELRVFIDTYVTSFLAWDLLVFFHKNPGTADSAVDLALKLGRKPEDVDRAARELAERSILRNESSVYSYTPDEEARAIVAKFIEALEHRDKRLLILTAVLQKR